MYQDSEGVFHEKKSVNTCFYGLLEAACITVLKFCSAAFPTGLCLCLAVSAFCSVRGRADGKMGGSYVGTDPEMYPLCCLFEFITGIIVNKWLGLYIWDYTDQPLQLFGQICLPFAIIFSGLCTCGICLGGYLAHWLYGEIRPTLHFL